MVVGVTISSFKLKEKNVRKEEYIPFYSNFSRLKRNCPYSCNDIIELIKEFYNAKLLPERNDYYQKYFGTKKDSFEVKEENDRIYISFTILCGAYGINSDITDIKTSEVLFNRKIDNADVKEFRIMIACAKKQAQAEVKKGVILFQVIGQYGIKTITVSQFRNFLSDNFNIIPILYSVSTREAFEKLLEQGSFKKINLIRNNVEPKFSNILGINCGKEKRTIAVANIKERKRFIDRLTDLATSGKEVYEIDGTQYNDISITIDMGGRIRTASIKDVDSLYIVETLPNNVLGPEGEMVVPIINNAMMKYANDYLDNIVEGEETFA